MMIEAKELLSFQTKDLKAIVKADIKSFQLLKKGDLMSCFKFICMVAGDVKPEGFVTMCPLLLENKDNIFKNTGIKIMEAEELFEEVKTR